MPCRRILLLFALLLASACQTVSAQPVLKPAQTSQPAGASAPVSKTPPTATATAIETIAADKSIAQQITNTPIPASPTVTETLAKPPITTLLFTGVIVPARCVQASLDALDNPDYPYEEVRQVITQADIAVGTFNATMSDKVAHTGCVWTYQLVGSPENADALANAGFDLMSVATNHIKDCGLMKSWCDEIFFDTLGHFRRVGIATVGAGANLAEALEPVVLTANGIRFGFVSLGDSKLSETVFAADDHPGIARLTEENMRTALAKARQVADVVIAMPHWGSEDILLPNWIQRQQAQYIVDAGADLVVGNHTHVVQAYQVLDGVQVFYGLGNFVFDQGLRDHRQGVILLVQFEGTEYLGYELIPTHVDPDGRVHLAGAEEAAEILQRVQAASASLP